MRYIMTACLISIATNALSAEFFVLPGTSTLLVLGETELTDVETIEQYITEEQVDALILNGPGGNLTAGYAIADIVLDQGLSTTVPENTDCASACSLIFSAGNTRKMESGSRLGFHLPFAVLSADEVEGYCNAVVPKNSNEDLSAVLFRATAGLEANVAECLMLTYQQGLRDIQRLSKILDRDDISEAVLDLIMDTESSDMTWVDVPQALEYGLMSPID
jgi:hypothetical protein